MREPPGGATVEPPRARSLGWVLPGFETGRHNDITDVPGVLVGQRTLRRGTGPEAIRTGATVVLPHGGNLRRAPVTAAVHVINGYGKPTGFEQVRELGEIETPIALTNTLCVGAAFTALVRHALAQCPELGRRAGTVNPVVAECNDARLNDIRARAVRPRHVLAAIDRARGGPVRQGAVGAGTGMVGFGWKAGIGSASAVLDLGGRTYVLGVLSLVNFGRPDELTVRGVPVGRALPDPLGSSPDAAQPESRPGPAGLPPGQATEPPAGSLVCVVATDAPLDARQLGRLARRVTNGTARLGGATDAGSGEFVIAFTTDRTRERFPDSRVRFDPLFRALAGAVEESILDSLLAARAAHWRTGTVPVLPQGEVSRLLAGS